jgi:alkaline phosphatase
MNKITATAILIISIATGALAQYSTLNAHSHNDYAQQTPFFMAYNAHFGSIEADVWAVDGELFVAHNRAEITRERTLDVLYLQPVLELFRQNGGKPWRDNPTSFQLLIDLKTAVEPTLSLLVEKLKKYPAVFDPKKNKYAVRVVISGNRPDPAGFGKYPRFIFFDGILNQKYTTKELKRVPLFSENLKVFTAWNGTGDIPAREQERLMQVIDSVHALNRKIRFWNAPDSPPAWKTLMNLKVDYLNTDHIAELEEFLKSHKN